NHVHETFVVHVLEKLIPGFHRKLIVYVKIPTWKRDQQFVQTRYERFFVQNRLFCHQKLTSSINRDALFLFDLSKKLLSGSASSTNLATLPGFMNSFNVHLCVQ